MRLTPRARTDRVDGWRLDSDGRPVLAVRVRAAPIEGEANAALEALMAKSLGVFRAQVSAARGVKGRLKAVSVDGIEAADLERAFGRAEFDRSI